LSERFQPCPCGDVDSRFASTMPNMDVGPTEEQLGGTSTSSSLAIREGLARDLLHDRHGALADERDRHRVGAHAVARDAAGGVGGAGLG